MEIIIDDLLKKREACIKNIDKNKTCASCKNENTVKCDTCYNEMLGMPINPTNWEGK